MCTYLSAFVLQHAELHFSVHVSVSVSVFSDCMFVRFVHFGHRLTSMLYVFVSLSVTLLVVFRRRVTLRMQNPMTHSAQLTATTWQTTQ